MDFLVREQLLSICHEDLRVLLKTHVLDNPSAQELAQKADGYAEAIGGVEHVLKRNQVPIRGNLYRNRPNFTRSVPSGRGQARICKSNESHGQPMGQTWSESSMSGSARGVNSQGYRGQSFSRGQWLNQAPRR